jgi:hypothetical protein
LSGWKEIAGQLGVDVRTVQRWEKKFNLPILRNPGARSRVHADSQALEIWRQQLSRPSSAPPISDKPGRNLLKEVAPISLGSARRNIKRSSLYLFWPILLRLMYRLSRCISG